MSNCSSRVTDSLATDGGDDSNFQISKKYSMFDGLQDQAAAIEDFLAGESEGGKEEEEEKARVAFRIRSGVEEPDDGYNWRKYGKKSSIGGRKIERNYYKCTEIGCPVKKKVEKDRKDPTNVITTYKGVHNHNSSS
ncbi:hypothetical protein SLA2020_396820, partial [Shorea laevis]